MNWSMDRGRRMRRWVLVPALVLLLGSVAGAAPGGSSGGAEERTVTGAREDMPGGTAQARAEVRRLIEEELRAGEARRAQLNSSDARAARGRSRRAHRRQSEREARTLLKHEFGPVLDDLFYEPTQLIDDGRIVEILGDRTALVQTPAGTQLLESSTLPLRARDASGRESAVGLELNDRGTYFAPQNPLVPVRVPEDLDDGIVFGASGVRIHLAEATAESHGAILDDRRVVYPNVPGAEADTDFVAQPSATGVELFWQLRSEDSPEAQTLRFELPNDATLERRDDGSVEIVRGDDKLGAILPPHAIDAQGQTVPASMHLRGTELEVVARHQGGDFAYPILLDPPVVQDWSLFATNPAALANWEYFSERPDRFQAQLVCNPFVSCGTGEGLFIYAPSGTYNADDFAEWYYAPPCAHSLYSSSCETQACITTPCPETRSSYLTFLRFNNSFHDRQGYDYRSGSVVGVWSPDTFSWTALNVTTSTFSNSIRYADPPDSRTDGNTAVFSIWQYDGGLRPSWASVYTGGAYMLLSDAENPTTRIRSHTAPGDWTREVRDFNIEVESFDPGLGAKQLRVQAPSGGTIGGLGPTRTNPCEGHREFQCPRSYVDTFTASTANLPDGSNVFQASSSDVLGKASASVPVSYKLDRGGPTLSLSGSLNDARGQTVPADSTFNLNATATDGDTITPRSGVRTLELYVDGVRREPPKSNNCTGNTCPSTLADTLTFDTNVAGLGEHSFRVVARDGVGNERSDTFAVTFAPPSDFDQCFYETGNEAYCNLHDREQPSGVEYNDPDPAPTSDILVADECEAAYGPGSPYCATEPDDALAPQTFNDAFSAAAAGVEYGIADDAYGGRRPGALGDDGEFFLRTALFAATGVKKVRRIVPYNLMDYRATDPPTPEFQRFVTFYEDAVDRGVQIMVSFQYRDAGIAGADDGSGVADTNCSNTTDGDQAFVPSKADYVSKVRHFKRRFPRVKYYSAWNEPNEPRQPLHVRNPCGGPRRAAVYTDMLQRHLCPPNANWRCGVVAGDLAQAGRWSIYERDYLSALQNRGASIPAIWGFHPYTDVDLRDSAGVRNFKDRAPTGARIWITEVGSRRDKGCEKNAGSPCNTETSQAGDIDTFMRFTIPNTGIERFYHYHWREPLANDPLADPDGTRFDSGLLNPDGSTRQVYDIFKQNAGG